MPERHPFLVCTSKHWISLIAIGGRIHCCRMTHFPICAEIVAVVAGEYVGKVSFWFSQVLDLRGLGKLIEDLSCIHGDRDVS